MKFQIDPITTKVLDENGNVVLEAPSDTVAKFYFSATEFDIGLLPPAVRWLSKNGRRIMLERPPTQVTVTYGETTYEIPLPWTVWVLEFSQQLTLERSRVFARSYPLSSEQDELGILPFPGVNANNEIPLTFQPDTLFSLTNELGHQLLPLVQNYWKPPMDGASFEHPLESFPPEWQETMKDAVETHSIEKFFTELQGKSAFDVNFVQYVRTTTMAELIGELEITTEEKQDLSALELLEQFVRRAKEAPL